MPNFNEDFLYPSYPQDPIKTSKIRKTSGSSLYNETMDDTKWKIEACNKLEDPDKKLKCKNFVYNQRIEDLNTGMFRCKTQACINTLNAKIMKISQKLSTPRT